MAHLPALISALSRIWLLDEAAAGVIGRKLREGGVISAAGRGSSAAVMTARDAAALLIGLASGVSPGRAPELVRQYLAMIRVGADHSDPDRSLLPRDVTAAPTFGQALEALVAFAGELYERFEVRAEAAFGPERWQALGERAPLAGSRDSPIVLEVELEFPSSARITLRPTSGLLWSCDYLVDISAAFPDGARPASDIGLGMAPSLRRGASFDFRPVLAAHFAVVGGDADV